MWSNLIFLNLHTIPINKSISNTFTFQNTLPTYNGNIIYFPDELGLNKDRYKSLADEMDSTFAELAGY